MSTNLTYFWKKKTLISFSIAIFVIVIHNSATWQYTGSSDIFSNTTLFIRNFFAYGLGAIAVPLFFFLSGLALFRNFKLSSYPTKMRSRIKTILIPYLLWNTIGLLFCLLYTYTPLSNYITSREVFEPSFQNIFEGIFLYRYNIHFWFLYDLIIYMILSPVFYFLVSKKSLGIIFGLLLIILPIFTESFLHLNLYFTAFFYFGCFVGKHYLHLFTKPAPKRTCLIAGIITVVTTTLRMLSIYNIIQIPVIPSQFNLFILVISTWFFADLFIPHLKAYRFTTEFFPIYTLHPYFLSIIVKLFCLISTDNSLWLLVSEIGSTCLAFVLVTAFSCFWHRKMPHSYKIAFGSRN